MTCMTATQRRLPVPRRHWQPTSDPTEGARIHTLVRVRTSPINARGHGERRRSRQRYRGAVQAQPYTRLPGLGGECMHEPVRDGAFWHRGPATTIPVYGGT